ncbi:MAG: type I-E CRISPR-associated protein Cse2/CasB [Thiothrix sp.]|nr:MAG: type I-E CRISPR-associated protein Cse2/CasB [Thiothrix sp.]
MKRKTLFDPDNELGKALTLWWEKLQGKGEFEGKAQTADRAELSRAQTVTDVILLPSFQRACFQFKPLLQRRGESEWEKSIDRLAIILALLARVRENSSESLPILMASAKGEKPLLSELRFRRLIQRDRDALFGAMIRVLQVLGNKANIHDLADDIYYWGDNVKRQWAFTYFPALPTANSKPT